MSIDHWKEKFSVDEKKVLRCCGWRPQNLQEAFDYSLAKWEMIAEHPDIEYDESEFGLCVYFKSVLKTFCPSCPVVAGTRLSGCRNTPYLAALENLGKDPRMVAKHAREEIRFLLETYRSALPDDVPFEPERYFYLDHELNLAYCGLEPLTLEDALKWETARWHFVFHNPGLMGLGDREMPLYTYPKTCFTENQAALLMDLSEEITQAEESIRAKDHYATAVSAYNVLATLYRMRDREPPQIRLDPVSLDVEELSSEAFTGADQLYLLVPKSGHMLIGRLVYDDGPTFGLYFNAGCGWLGFVYTTPEEQCSVLIDECRAAFKLTLEGPFDVERKPAYPFYVDNAGKLCYKGQVPNTPDEALEMEIAYWEFVAKHAAEIRELGGPELDALCLLYSSSCVGCPVFAHTGLAGCQDTPYECVREALQTSDAAGLHKAALEMVELLSGPGQKELVLEQRSSVD